jgi:Uma2 family endonuclease
MAALITDPALEECIKAQRRESGADRYDEVWDGVYIIMPEPNVEHQRLVWEFVLILSEFVRPSGGGKVFPGVNLSDRIEDWKNNCRGPDVAVFFSGNPARVFEAHIVGPADFLIEIVSPGDRTREKFEFYSLLGVRELLIVDRYPWRLELYRHDGVGLVLVGQSTAETSKVIASTALPLTFQLLPAEPRPEVRVTETGGARSWSM